MARAVASCCTNLRRDAHFGDVLYSLNGTEVLCSSASVTTESYHFCQSNSPACLWASQSGCAFPGDDAVDSSCKPSPSTGFGQKTLIPLLYIQYNVQEAERSSQLAVGVLPFSAISKRHKCSNHALDHLFFVVLYLKGFRVGANSPSLWPTLTPY